MGGAPRLCRDVTTDGGLGASRGPQRGPVPEARRPAVPGRDERWEAWGHLGPPRDDRFPRRGPAVPGRDERRGAWGPSRGPREMTGSRGAARLCRGVTRDEGLGGHLGAPGRWPVAGAAAGGGGGGPGARASGA